MRSNPPIGLSLVLTACILAALALGSCQAFDWGGSSKIWREPIGAPQIESPYEIAAPETATAGIPVTVIVRYQEDNPYREFVRSDTELNSESIEFRINLWFQRFNSNAPPPPPEFVLTTKNFTVTFPKPGEWTIRSGCKSVPVTVLPAEG